MLPSDLAKLIKKYLNSNKILLLYDLINYANNVFEQSIVADENNEQTIRDVAQEFSDLGFTNVVSFDLEYNTYTLSLNLLGLKIEYINDKQIINFVNCLLNYIKYLDKRGNAVFTESLFIINGLLYKYKFNYYLLIMYYNNKTIYKWIKGKIIN